MQCQIEGAESTYSRVTGWQNTACGKYASHSADWKEGTTDGINARHRFDSKQAPALAYTPASASKQGVRMKPEGSHTLLCASGLRSTDSIFWHDAQLASNSVRTATALWNHTSCPRYWGEIPDEQYPLAIFWAKNARGVSKNDVKRRF